MKKRFERSAMLLGVAAMQRLETKAVAVFGAGGVGGYAIEMLARSGIGSLTIIDSDVLDETNINRQIFALDSTIGQPKAEAAAARIRDINPEIHTEVCRLFFLPENAESIDFTQYDYIVDAVDTVSAKLEIIRRAKAAAKPVISAMGAGNKRCLSRFQVADISETSGCPLARVMRRELKKAGIRRVKVVYSSEAPMKPIFEPDAAEGNQRIKAGSLPFAPATAGILLAAEVVQELLQVSEQ